VEFIRIIIDDYLAFEHNDDEKALEILVLFQVIITF